MIATSSQHQISFTPEVDYGVTPDSPALQKLTIVGTTLGLTKGTIKTATINPNRQTTDVRHGHRQVGGEISTELAYGAFDTLFEALFCGTWAKRVANKTASTLSASAADNSINDSASGLPIYLAGEKLTITGFTGTVGNNQVGTVVTSTTSKVVLTTTTALVDDAAGEAVTLALPVNQLVPGVTRRSFSVLRQFTELEEAAKPFQLVKGVELNTMSLTVKPEGFVTAGFSVIGRELETLGEEPTGATYTSASANKGFDGFTGVLSVDGDEMATITEIQLTLENGLEPRWVIFDPLTQRPKIGKTSVSGTITTFFENSALLDAFIAAEKKELEFSLVDLAGNTIRFYLPSILLNGGQTDVNDQTDITIKIPFSAVYETGESVPDVLRITRVPA